MSFLNINNSISNTVGSFVGTFTSDKTGPYLNYKGVTNRIIPGNWKLSLPYSFEVIGVSASGVLGEDGPLSGLWGAVGNPSGGGMFDEIYLPINPQDINQTESFAISITPTQRGIVAEHNGVVLKELTISGTTGMRPIADMTGYEAFQQLRNYFRSYAEFKKQPDQKKAQLIFNNRKDNEFLIIEPQSFLMKRSAGRPFLYDYSITLKVLGHRVPEDPGGWLGRIFYEADEIANKVSDYIQKARFVFQKAGQLPKTIEREIESSLMEPIENVNLAFKSSIGAFYSFADMPSNLANGLSSRTKASFLDMAKAAKNRGDTRFASVKIPADTAKESKLPGGQVILSMPFEARGSIGIQLLSNTELDGFNQAINNARAKDRRYYENVLAENTRIRDNAAEQFGVGNTGYDSFVGRTSTAQPDPDRIPSSEEVQLLEGFALVEKAMAMVLSTDTLFRLPISNNISQVRRNYDSSLNLMNTQSVDEISLPSNTTLEDLAAQYLGSAEKWIDIAIINNLIAPYTQSEISTNPRIRSHGQKILIPRKPAPTSVGAPTTKPLRISDGLNETEKGLGIDIKINKDFDFILNNVNDFQLIAGGENAGQAVIIKLALEKGSLKYHPNIGVGLNIGEKIRSGIDIRDNITRSILSDRRFSAIKNMNFSALGSTIQINFNLIIRGLLTPIPLVLNV